MPDEQTGLVKENYVWSVLLHRGATPEGVFLHLPPGSYDHDLFTMTWGPTIAALSYVFDKSLDENILQKAITGFRYAISNSQQLRWWNTEVFGRTATQHKTTSISFTKGSPFLYCCGTKSPQPLELFVVVFFYSQATVAHLSSPLFHSSFSCWLDSIHHLQWTHIILLTDTVFDSFRLFLNHSIPYAVVDQGF